MTDPKFQIEDTYDYNVDIDEIIDAKLFCNRYDDDAYLFSERPHFMDDIEGKDYYTGNDKIGE
jgi:hypothetical protein